MFFLNQTGIAFPKKIIRITLVKFIENVQLSCHLLEIMAQLKCTVSVNHVDVVLNFEMTEHGLEKSPASKEISMRMH